MKFKLAAVTLFACVAMMCSQSNGQLLDRMLDRGGCGCDAAPSCCDTPASSCGEESLCSKLKIGKPGGLFGSCDGCGSKAPVLTCGCETGFDSSCGGGGRLTSLFKPRGNGLLAVGTGASAGCGVPTIDTCGPTCSAIEAAPGCGCSGGSGCGLGSGSLWSKIKGGCTAGGCAGGASKFGLPAVGSCEFGAPASDAGSCGCSAPSGDGGCKLFSRLKGSLGCDGGSCGAPAPVAEPCGCSAPAPVAEPCGCSAPAPAPAPVAEPCGCSSCGDAAPSCGGGGLLKGLFGRVGSLGCGGGQSTCGCDAPAPAPVAFSAPAPSCGCSAPAPAPAPAVVESSCGCSAPVADCGCGGGLDLRGRVSGAVSNLRPSGGCGGCGAPSVETCGCGGGLDLRGRVSGAVSKIRPSGGCGGCDAHVANSCGGGCGSGHCGSQELTLLERLRGHRTSRENVCPNNGCNPPCPTSNTGCSSCSGGGEVIQQGSGTSQGFDAGQGSGTSQSLGTGSTSRVIYDPVPSTQTVEPAVSTPVSIVPEATEGSVVIPGTKGARNGSGPVVDPSAFVIKSN